MFPRLGKRLCLFLPVVAAACQAAPDSLLLDPPPVNPIPPVLSAGCDPAYFDATLDAGFDPPPDLNGPIGSPQSAPGAQWFIPGVSHPTITFLALPVAQNVTLADAAFATAESERNRALGNRVVLSGAIALDSGQDGWLIRSVNEAFVFAGVAPTTTVIVLAVERGRLFELRADGLSEHADALLASATSLCIEP